MVNGRDDNNCSTRQLLNNIAKNRNYIKNAIDTSEKKLLLSTENFNNNIRASQNENIILKTEIEKVRSKKNAVGVNCLDISRLLDREFNLFWYKVAIGDRSCTTSNFRFSRPGNRSKLSSKIVSVDHWIRKEFFKNYYKPKEKSRYENSECGREPLNKRPMCVQFSPVNPQQPSNSITT